jgi:hypothetical protein
VIERLEFNSDFLAHIANLIIIRHLKADDIHFFR